MCAYAYTSHLLRLCSGRSCAAFRAACGGIGRKNTQKENAAKRAALRCGLWPVAAFCAFRLWPVASAAASSAAACLRPVPLCCVPFYMVVACAFWRFACGGGLWHLRRRFAFPRAFVPCAVFEAAKVPILQGKEERRAAAAFLCAASGGGLCGGGLCGLCRFACGIFGGGGGIGGGGLCAACLFACIGGGGLCGLCLFLCCK